MTTIKRACAAFLAACLFTASVIAQDVRRADLIHSDLPLWTGGEGKFWPRPFVRGESFGCSHNILLGDWLYEENGQSRGWFALRNYGVFHCMLIVVSADDHAGLDLGQTEYGFLIDLGRTGARQGDVELWALQIGHRPGSDYLLLARKTAEPPIASFDVLQRECPFTNVRKGPNVGILLTNYCSINSQSELLQLARKMAKRKPFGRLTFIPGGHSGNEKPDVP